MTEGRTGLPIEDAFLHFRALISADMEWADSRKVVSRFRAAAIKVATVILGSAATVTLGFQNYKAGPEIALVLTGAVTMLGALELFFGWRAKWVLNSQTQYQLNRIRDEIDYYLVITPTGELQRSKLDEFFRQQQAVWSHASDRWLNAPDERTRLATVTNRDGDVPLDRDGAD